MTGSLRSVLLKLGLFTVVTLSLTALLAAVIGNIQPFASFYDVQAEFSDATGLLKQDVVKVAGVTVGKVSGAEVQVDERTGKASALVTMQVRESVKIPRNAHAAIKFRNLIGQRMIVITQDPDEPKHRLFPRERQGPHPAGQHVAGFRPGDRVQQPASGAEHSPSGGREHAVARSCSGLRWTRSADPEDDATARRCRRVTWAARSGPRRARRASERCGARPSPTTTTTCAR